MNKNRLKLRETTRDGREARENIPQHRGSKLPSESATNIESHSLTEKTGVSPEESSLI